MLSWIKNNLPTIYYLQAYYRGRSCRVYKFIEAPAPDAFCSEFNKMFRKILVRPLTNMHQHYFDQGHLLPSLNIANASLVLKKGKVFNKCGSYCPVSLIGVDSKLLSKVLAKRLEKLLPNLINPNQTRFIHD